MLAIVLAILLGNDLGRDEAIDHYARLFAESGHGRLPRERAGFLLRERDGGLTFAPWNVSDFARASYDGAVPANAIALVHTHPSSHSPLPSARDVAEARRLGIAVVVVSRDGVTAARASGVVERLVTAERMRARASGTARVPASRRTPLLR